MAVRATRHCVLLSPLKQARPQVRRTCRRLRFLPGSSGTIEPVTIPAPPAPLCSPVWLTAALHGDHRRDVIGAESGLMFHASVIGCLLDGIRPLERGPPSSTNRRWVLCSGWLPAAVLAVGGGGAAGVERAVAATAVRRRIP